MKDAIVSRTRPGERVNEGEGKEGEGEGRRTNKQCGVEVKWRVERKRL